MALFLRGNVWWFEVKTTKLRVVKSTGFRKGDRKKAEAAFAAFKLGLGTKPKRSAMEAMLDAIYSSQQVQPTGFPLASVWNVYLDWMMGKSKLIAEKTLGVRHTSVTMFCEFCAERGLTDIGDASVQVARNFVATLAGKANKTIRNRVHDLSTVWEACSQIKPGVFNPWKAACPDDDGTGKRRDDFSADERSRLFAAARELGHDWFGVSTVSCYTGLRYGDVATLEWGSAKEACATPTLDHGVVDLAAGVIVVDPHKTQRHHVRVTLPIAAPIAEALAGSDVREGFVFPEHALCHTQNLKMHPAYSEVIARAGVEGYHDFHSWRHTFRSMLAAAGVSDDTARRMGGWTNIAMAAHYDHDPHLDAMRDAVAAISATTR